METIKSDALEPTSGDLKHMPLRTKLHSFSLVYGLPAATILLIIIFSILLPTTFPTRENLHAIISVESPIALLALAAMIPMIAGRIDLTTGYGIVIWSILVISFQTDYGIPWELSIIAVIILGGIYGLLNGILVEVAQIDSFIATLGTGTILYALALWYTNGTQVVGNLPKIFTSINTGSFLGIPTPAYIVIIFVLLIWFFSERTPIGRVLYAIGANSRAAELNGVRVKRYVVGSFVASGVLTAVAGVMLAAQLRVGQASVGLSYLLPALVGAFLGSTTIRPGRVNVWGTITAIIILSVGISGIEQMGAAFYVAPLFNGIILVVSIGLAGLAQRRGQKRKRKK